LFAAEVIVSLDEVVCLASVAGPVSVVVLAYAVGFVVVGTACRSAGVFAVVGSSAGQHLAPNVVCFGELEGMTTEVIPDFD